MQGKPEAGHMEVISETEREDHNASGGLSSRSSLLSPTPDMSQSLNGLIRRNYSQVFPEPMENLKPLDRESTNTPDETDTPIEPLPPLRSIFGDFLPQRPPQKLSGGNPFSNSSPAAFTAVSPAQDSRAASSSPSPSPVTFSTEPPAAYLSQMTSIPPRVTGHREPRSLSTDSSQFGPSSSSRSSPSSALAFSASDSASFLSLIRASTEDEGGNSSHHNPHRPSTKLSNKMNNHTTFFSDPCHPAISPSPDVDMDDPMGDGINEEHASGRGPRVCSVCGTNSTPRWRRGPRGRQTLCNSCGLKFIRKKKKEMKGRGD